VPSAPPELKAERNGNQPKKFSRADIWRISTAPIKRSYPTHLLEAGRNRA
jgi:hypothetical protein